jgi:hypothetical protein
VRFILVENVGVEATLRIEPQRAAVAQLQGSSGALFLIAAQVLTRVFGYFCAWVMHCFIAFGCSGDGRNRKKRASNPDRG